MKKIIAILLILVTIVSFAIPASAREFIEDMNEVVMFSSNTDRTLTEPGADETVTFQLKVKQTDEMKEKYDENGMLVIPFMLYTGDTSMDPLMNVKINEDAQKLGCKYIDTNAMNGNEDEEAKKSIWFGAVKIPAKYLLTEGAIDVLDVQTHISEDWYAEYNNDDYLLNICILLGDNSGYPIYIDNSKTANDDTIKGYDMLDESTVLVDEFVSLEEVALLGLKPYEPTVKEKITEWFRVAAVKLVTMMRNIVTYLLDDTFAPAPWSKA